MQTETIRARVVEALVPFVAGGADSISDGATLSELGLDSVARTELLARLEDVFDLHVPAEDAIHLDTIDAVVHYVRRHER